MEIRKRKPTGRPPINQNTKDVVWKLYNEDTMTCKQIAEACNISLRSVYRITSERAYAYEQEKK